MPSNKKDLMRCGRSLKSAKKREREDRSADDRREEGNFLGWASLFRAAEETKWRASE